MRRRMPDARAAGLAEEDADGAAAFGLFGIFLRRALQDVEILFQRGHRHGIGAAGIALAALAVTGVKRERGRVEAITDRAADAAAFLREGRESEFHKTHFVIPFPSLPSRRARSARRSPGMTDEC